MDRDLGPRFADALIAVGVQARRHVDYFVHDTPDDVWLSDVTSRGWVVLTHDAKMRYTSLIRDSIIDINARVFLIAAHKLSSEQYSNLFINSLPKVLRFIRRHSPPYIAKVRRDPHDLGKPGTVELWYPIKD